MRMRKFLCLLLFVGMMAFNLPAYAYLEGTIGNKSWDVEDGNIIPTDDYDIGESGAEVGELFVDAITLGGSQKTSWGSVVSPMTDYNGYVTPTDAGSKLKLHDDGDLTLGGGVATDVVITFDSDSNDFYIGVNDTENELQLGYGSAIGTTEQISIKSDGTIMLGEDTDVDFGLIFQSGDQDYYFGIDYTGGTEEDLLTIGRGSTVGATPELAIGSSKVYVNHLDSFGNVDLDIGNVTLDDVTITTDGGTIILDGTITLTDGEIISNATDDTVRIASNDVATILEVYTVGTSNEDVSLRLTTDAGADAGDIIQLQHDGATNSLLIQSDTSAKGTPATIFTITKTGIVTTTNYIDNKITDTTTGAVVDVIKLTHDGGTAATGIGTGLVFQIDDAGGIEEQGSIDVSLSTVTNSSEDADMIIRLNQAGTMRDVLIIDSDPGVAGGTVLEFTSWTTETNGVIDILELTLDNTAETATDGFGAGISIIMEQEDSGTPVQQASIDFTLVDSSTGVEDCDVIFSQTTGGAVAETLRIVANSSATTGDSLEFTSNTTETDAVIDVLKLKLATGTAANGTGIAISFEPEDATGSEQHASIDVVLTTAARATCDADFVFTQDVNGTLEERVRFDADDDTILLTGTTPKMTIGDADSEDTILAYAGNAQTYHMSLDDGTDDLIIGLGEDPDTTPIISMDENQVATFAQTVVFSGGQTRKLLIPIEDVELDGANAPSVAQVGTNAQAVFPSLQFDADGGGNGDDMVYIHWVVPDGYVTDSARLNVYWSFSTAEDAADEAQFDFTVNAIAEGEVMDSAGTALDDQATVVADASTDNGKLHVEQYNIEVEVIEIGDLVTIEVLVDESASALANSGTLDVHYFEIEWESNE